MPEIYLIPNTLGDSPISRSFPDFNLEIIRSIKHFAVEGEKSARKFLKSCGVMPPFEGVTLHLLDKRTSVEELSNIFTSAGENNIGILSEAGCPGVADPGSNLVLAAYARGWKVIPLVGPSSILMSLMASGLNGQSFTFHGYLPVGGSERTNKIKELELLSSQTGYTQVFIETPFRNEHLYADILKACKQNTLLSIACDITLPSEEINTLNIEQWIKKTVEVKNRQVVFSMWAPKHKKSKD